jgi:hypothetical protein
MRFVVRWKSDTFRSAPLVSVRTRHDLVGVHGHV